MSVITEVEMRALAELVSEYLAETHDADILNEGTALNQRRKALKSMMLKFGFRFNGEQYE